MHSRCDLRAILAYHDHERKAGKLRTPRGALRDMLEHPEAWDMEPDEEGRLTPSGWVWKTPEAPQNENGGATSAAQVEAFINREEINRAINAASDKYFRLPATEKQRLREYALAKWPAIRSEDFLVTSVSIWEFAKEQGV